MKKDLMAVCKCSTLTMLASDRMKRVIFEKLLADGWEGGKLEFEYQLDETLKDGKVEVTWETAH